MSSSHTILMGSKLPNSSPGACDKGILQARCAERDDRSVQRDRRHASIKPFWLEVSYRLAQCLDAAGLCDPSDIDARAPTIMQLCKQDSTALAIEASAHHTFVLFIQVS